MKRIVNKPALIIVFAGIMVVILMVGRSLATPARVGEQVVRISASHFKFQPSEITVKKGIPVTFELVSEEKHHGFNLPDFRIRADVQPGVVQKIRFVPDKSGKFNFACDVFCGEGHEDMSGTLTVTEE
jgi:cytochrome c oxidase subunit II